jgi:hypothetical protein
LQGFEAGYERRGELEDRERAQRGLYGSIKRLGASFGRGRKDYGFIRELAKLILLFSQLENASFQLLPVLDI